MASSQHRPGAKVTLSPAGYSKQQMKKVENLEIQLEQEKSNNKKTDDAASRLRMRLCEIVSDIILTDPLFSIQNDCIGRLWRSCFYGPIGVLRSRLSREKRKKGPNIAKLEKSLTNFLTEAITLYDYLILSYHGKLLPSGVDASAVTPNSQESLSQGDSQQSTQPQPSTNPAGIVPGLFRMYIHMGDLYRYNSNYSDAQKYYNSAAKLSPGRGNPYNQLAVVAQLKDTAAPLNAVALFWYARSLLTTFEPFEISKANLARLFQSNRDWFHKQPPPPPDVLKPTTTGAAADGNNSNNNGGREMVKAQRTVASRHFLSQFVDLHFSFFQGVKGTGDGQDAAAAAATKDALKNMDDDVVEQMEAILVPLSVLLRASAFGDALLCKMVVICAFSEAYNPHNNEGQPKSQGIKDTEILARVFTMAFGACLAERAAVGLKKIQDQPEKMGNPGKAPPSVRLLLPLLLVCEYIESRPIGVESQDLDESSLSPRARAFCKKTVGMFWQRNIDVMNILTNLRGPLSLDVNNGSSNWENSNLKEFHNLVGYSPFEAFLDDPMASSREDGFASIEEAVQVLELTQTQNSSSQDSNTQQSLTQGSAASAGGGTQSVEEYKVKVARFLAFGDRMADMDDTTKIVGRRFERNAQGTYVWENEELEDEVMEDNDGNDNPMMDEENMEDNNETQPPVSEKGDEGGDVLVYSVPEGGGPALLVPGMLLQNRALSNAPGDNEPKQSAAAEGPLAGPPMPFGAPGIASPFGMAVDDPNPPPQPTPAPPPSVMPPPGFGVAAAPPAPTLPIHGVAAQAPLAMGGNLNIPGYPPMMGHGAGMAAGFHQGYGSIFPQQHQQQRFEPTIGNSMHMFGGPEALKTGNPFAAASTPSIDANGNMMLGPHMNGGGGIGSTNTGSFLHPGVPGVSAESNLLGSGLLSSLFEDAGDQTTKNPFST